MHALSVKKYNIKIRLPYEAEWEYACRAGTTSKYYWGDDFIGDYCWYYKNANDKPHPVGNKNPNAWGLYDMIGNVYEFCMDWWDEDYYEKSPFINPKGPLKPLRGYCWWEHHIDPGRSSARFWIYTNYIFGFMGFRVVIPVE